MESTGVPNSGEEVKIGAISPYLSNGLTDRH